MRTTKFIAGTLRATGVIVSMVSKENQPGNGSGRQEIDDLPGNSHLDKPEINNDKQKLDKGRYINNEKQKLDKGRYIKAKTVWQIHNMPVL